MAAAAASLSMVMLSMSLGFMPPMPLMKMLSKAPAAISSELRFGLSFCSGTPSTTQSGLLLPERLLVPLILMRDWVPGCPETACTCTPATSPCIRELTLARGLSLKLSELSIPTDPVILLTVVWAYPVTTTWSSIVLSYSRTIKASFTAEFSRS